MKAASSSCKCNEVQVCGRYKSIGATNKKLNKYDNRCRRRHRHNRRSRYHCHRKSD